MIKTNDFFFGEYTTTYEGASIQLSRFMSLTQKVSRDFFTSQMNRMLQDNAGRVTVVDDSSYPPFHGLIEGLDGESVGFVDIYAVTDFNEGRRATLACDIVMKHGVISVKANWNAKNDSDVSGVVSTLLAPLHFRKLQEKTFVRQPDKLDTRLLDPTFNDYESELRLIYSISHYGFLGDVLEENKKCFSKNVLGLKTASEIGKQNLSMEDAYTAWQADR